MLRRVALACSLGCLTLVLLAAGCTPTEPDALRVDASDSQSATGDGAAASRAIPVTEVRLDVVDGEGYQAALDGHRGNVVLVDFWATWCEPCTENFPHIVELHHKHQADGLRVISFSTDDEPTAEVKQFLADNGAAFDNLITKFGNGTQTNDIFGIHGVPYYKLYDRKGVLRYQFAEIYDGLDNGEPVEKIDERIAELLAERP